MDYLIHILIFISIFSILGITLDLVIGYTGLLSVAHAVFFGIGAYTTAILSTRFDFNFFLTLIIGMILTSILAFFFSLILNRFKGDYYAIISFGLNIIIFTVFLGWQTLTNGPLGIAGIPKPLIFGHSLNSNLEFLVLSIIFLIIVFGISYFITKSTFGRTLKTIREDELVAQTFGYQTNVFKIFIFTLSAALASIAGSLFASYISFIDPSSFALMESVFILTIIIIGGIANIRGAVLGAIILILLPEILRFVGMPVDIAAQMRQLIYGLMLILMMFFRPQGILGKFKM